MINYKSEEDLKIMRIACKITGDTLKLLEKSVKPGISTLELDKIAYDYIKSQGARPSFKNYEGFPATICASINDEIVHGIPSKDRILKEGDIISLDVGACYKGFHGDAARTFPVGKITPANKRLIKVTEQSFFEGIKDIKAGCHIGDISSKIQNYVEKKGYSIVRELVGHGVGRHLHEDPDVPNYGRFGAGLKLNANATIAIEPMVNMGERNITFSSNGWTCCTLDGLPAAHYENTILITENGVEILTL